MCFGLLKISLFISCEVSHFWCFVGEGHENVGWVGEGHVGFKLCSYRLCSSSLGSCTGAGHIDLGAG